MYLINERAKGIRAELEKKHREKKTTTACIRACARLRNVRNIGMLFFSIHL